MKESYVQMGRHFLLYMGIDFTLCIGFECASTLTKRAFNWRCLFTKRTFQNVSVHLKRWNTDLAAKGRVGAWFSHILNFTTRKVVGKHVVFGQRFIVDGAAVVSISVRGIWQRLGKHYVDIGMEDLLYPWGDTLLAESMTTRRYYWLVQPVDTDGTFKTRFQLRWFIRLEGKRFLLLKFLSGCKTKQQQISRQPRT